MGTISFANSGPELEYLDRTIGLAGGSLPRPSGPSRPWGIRMVRRSHFYFSVTSRCQAVSAGRMSPDAA